MLLMHPGPERSAPRELPRSVLVLLCLVAGYVLALQVRGVPASLWFGIAGLLACAAAWLRGPACAVALAVSAVALGGGWFTARLLERSPEALHVQLENQPALVMVEGLVLESPRELARERSPLDPPLSQQRVRLTRMAVRGVVTDGGAVLQASGVLRVRIAGAGDAPAAGEFVRVLGRFEPLRPPLNAGERDQRLWRGQEGIVGSLRVQGGARRGPFERADDAGGVWALRARWAAARSAMADRARAILLGDGAAGNEGRALMGALVLGEEDPSLREVRGAYQRLGLVHALSISGFHLVVMAGVVLIALRCMGDLGWLEPLLACVLIAVYLVILPFNAPVWRAGLMICAVLTADALGRRYDRLAVLGWAAVLLALWRPMDVWSIGFQLSFGLVGALIAFGHIAHQRLWGIELLGTVRAERRPALGWGVDQAKRLITANLLCWGIATPIIMFHAGVVSIAAVPAGVVMVPVIAVLLVFGYTALVLGVLIPPAGEHVASLAEIAAGWSVRMTDWLDAVPGASVQGPVVSLLWAVAAAGLVIYWFVRGHGRDLGAWSLTLVCSAWLAGEAWLWPRPPGGALLRVDAVAVGDGTCMLVRSGSSAVLWDCGSLDGRVGEVVVPRTLRALGVSRVPVMIITHPNLDHFNGVLDVAGPLGVRTVVVGEEFLRQAAARPAGAESFVLDGLAARGIEVRAVAAGQNLQHGALRFTFLSPPKGAAWRPDNEMSLVAAVSADGVAAGPGVVPLLLTGDVQSTAIEALGAAYPDLRALIVEAPHHGSARPAVAEFVRGLRARVVLQSTGPERAGDPLWDGVRGGLAWYCTAVDGGSWAAVDGEGRATSGSHRGR